MVELLSPVGDFECLQSAVQNGADSVYLGGSAFNARASASNFDKDGLKQAIRYAKLRNVKINFALNTLIKDDEFEDAVNLAKYVYTLGADAIIVQDLGLAKYIINNMPEMDVHGSTQMTIHNLQGVLALEKLGFKRVVLSRELSLSEIEYICNNSNVEIEVFAHGALCISYSGQCLFSSTIGARSGNRGRCAQPCRLPYELIDEENNSLDKGYLLSPRDLCSLEYIPDLIKAGVTSFKIEGRMKTPEYVAVVTSIYRKYIDLALSDEDYKIDKEDIKKLMQVFNRGGFSTGNLNDEENLNYVYKEKPNNMGLYVGNVSSFNKNKGLITFKTSETLSIGDSISLEKESHKYTVTELMKNKQNIERANIGDLITIGRMKGNISLGDKIYKLSSKSLSKAVSEYYKSEHKKAPLSCAITIKKGYPVTLKVKSLDDGIYSSMEVIKEIDVTPIDAISNPISKERIIEQLSKTTDTPFEFTKIDVDLDDNTYLPKISAINSLRRDCLQELENLAIKKFERVLPNYQDTANLNMANSKDKNKTSSNIQSTLSNDPNVASHNPSISLLLNELNPSYDYTKLLDVDRIYIPLKFFNKKDLTELIKNLSGKFELYVYMPTIVKDNYRNIIYNSLDKYIEEFNIKGIVASNLASINSLKKYIGKLNLIGNYTLNVFNSHSIIELSKLNINMVTLSPELDEISLKTLCSTSPIPTELMVYGKLPVMNMGYCLLGSSNKCYPKCKMRCKTSSKYYIKDRLGYKFRIVPDNIQTVTTIYNSKITSIPYENICPSSVRISILDENINEINEAIKIVKEGKTFSSKDYTYGNLYKNV